MLNKGAVTRINNDGVRARARGASNAPGGQAASRALASDIKRAPVKKAASPVGNQTNQYPEVLSAPPVAIPTGGPSPMPQQEFDPELFQQNMVDNIVGTVRTHQFLNSAAAQDAKTSVELKEMFNQFNPNKKPDPRSMVDRVVNRMGINPNEER